jgi:hypothetical protein
MEILKPTPGFKKRMFEQLDLIKHSVEKFDREMIMYRLAELNLRVVNHFNYEIIKEKKCKKPKKK